MGIAMRTLIVVPVLWVAGACAATQPMSLRGESLSAMTAPRADVPETPPQAVLVGENEFAHAPLQSRGTSSGGTSGASEEGAGPTACADGMVLVEGDYCTEVEHTCKRHWYDKSNKKEVCEEFEPTAKCVGKKVKKRFCIDQFAWPNVEGERPEVMNNFYQAQVKCAAAGKRMCTESEWTMSCEGPKMQPFPYGYVRDAKKCNGDHKWDDPDMDKVAKRNATELARLWRGVPSGSQPLCVSDYGVFDLPGNTDEVVAGESRRAKFSSVHTGGPWYKGVRNQCRPKIYTHDEGFYYYFLSFRCCAEPDGKPNEPRTKKQIADSWNFSSVERLAQFTVDEMKEKLALKKQGRCDCAPGARLCRTMCGTLLGPNVKDGDDSTRMGAGE
jgi:hypothetical protein